MSLPEGDETSSSPSTPRGGAAASRQRKPKLKNKDGDSAIRRALVRDTRALTEVLHNAYAEHIAAGLNFTAGTQDETQTGKEIREREVYLIRRRTRPVATVTLAAQQTRAGLRRLYINHLAVVPAARESGLAGRLLDHAERVARRRGIRVLRLDTATQLHDLIDRYGRRGFKLIGERQWAGKTYRSVLMEKLLK